MPEHDESSGNDFGLTRRQSMRLAGAAGAATVLGGGIAGISSLEDSDDLAEAARKCVKLAPELTEGPFYVDLDQIRRDITEGSAGVPLRLRVRVINVKTCKPIRKAAVDIWHANAAGKYSSEASEGTSGQTFLRGIQLTNKKGFATFDTVYPGHYQGRATHIHVKVHIGGANGRVSHTGQLFVDDSVSDQAYTNPAYGTGPRVSNGSDSIYREGGSKSLLKISGSAASGFVGAIVLGVNPRVSR